MDTNKEFFKKAASRKFITMNVYELIWIAMVLLGGISEATFQALTIATIGGYMAFNVLAKFSGKPNE